MYQKKNFFVTLIIAIVIIGGYFLYTKTSATEVGEMVNSKEQTQKEVKSDTKEKTEEVSKEGSIYAKGEEKNEKENKTKEEDEEQTLVDDPNWKLEYPLEPLRTMQFIMKHPNIDPRHTTNASGNVDAIYSIPRNKNMDNVAYEGVYSVNINAPTDNITFIFKMKATHEDGKETSYNFSMQENEDNVVFYIEEDGHGYWGYYNEAQEFIKMEY